MLTFYYSKGSSALAAHILLSEVGARFEAIEVSIQSGAHRTPEFLARNPKGRIPILDTPEGVLTENPAILEYIAATHPGSGCLPQGAFAQAQARSLCAYLCATVHVAFAHAKRGRRWAATDAAIRDMQQVSPGNLRDCAALLEDQLNPDPWALGTDYSFCDPYLFLMDHWLSGVGASLDAYPGLAAHRDAMLARPATRAALAVHGAL